MPKDTVVMAFSLSPEASSYIRGAGSGRRSALVNRCVLYYKDNRVQDLLDQISFMEGNIAGLQSKLLNAEKPGEYLEQITGSREVSDQKAKKVSQSRGLRRFLDFSKSKFAHFRTFFIGVR